MQLGNNQFSWRTKFSTQLASIQGPNRSTLQGKLIKCPAIINVHISAIDFFIFMLLMVFIVWSSGRLFFRKISDLLKTLNDTFIRAFIKTLKIQKKNSIALTCTLMIAGHFINSPCIYRRL